MSVQSRETLPAVSHGTDQVPIYCLRQIFRLCLVEVAYYFAKNSLGLVKFEKKFCFSVNFHVISLKSYKYLWCEKHIIFLKKEFSASIHKWYPYGIFNILW